MICTSRGQTLMVNESPVSTTCAAVGATNLLIPVSLIALPTLPSQIAGKLERALADHRRDLEEKQYDLMSSRQQVCVPYGSAHGCHTGQGRLQAANQLNGINGKGRVLSTAPHRAPHAFHPGGQHASK